MTVCVCRFLVHASGESVATDGSLSVWKSDIEFGNYPSVLESWLKLIVKFVSATRCCS